MADGTGGHANPDWTRDELILALDVYLSVGAAGNSHPDAVALSELLRSLPLHLNRGDPETFRNLNGVTQRLANFASYDPAHPGKALTNGGRAAETVWNELGGKPELVHQLATAIRACAAEGGDGLRVPEDDEDDRVSEGRLLYRRHRQRERNRQLVARKKKAVLAKLGALACEACGFDFSKTYGLPGQGFIECHHAVPLASSGATTTKLSDLILLCSNCHRMVHRVQPWMTLGDLKHLMAAQAGGGL